MHAGRLRVLEPERELHPFAHPLLDEILAVDVREVGFAAGNVATGLRERLPRDAFVNRVEASFGLAFGEVDQPARQVADVDELDGSLARSRDEDFAAACDPVGPVREAPGGVVRADDEPRADECMAVRNRLRDRTFAEHLQSAVVRVVVEQSVDGLVVGELLQWARFVGRLAEVVVDGDARDEEVVAGRVGKRFSRRSDGAWDVAARVEDSIPRAALEGREVVLAVPVELLGLGEELGIRSAAVEEGDLVIPGERGFDGCAAEELRPAENEELHNPNRTVRACGFLTRSAVKQ